MISGPRIKALLVDNNVSLGKWQELTTKEIMVEEGIEWEVLDEMNTRLNMIEAKMDTLRVRLDKARI